MRQDQWERLQQLEEKLCDLFLEESDPERWPGSKLKKLTADVRAERYRHKRAAAETAMLLVRTQGLIGSVQGFGVTPPAEPSAPEPEAESVESAIEREVMDAERQAERLRSQLLKRLQDGKPNGPATG